MLRLAALFITAHALAACAFAPYPPGMGNGKAGVIGINVDSSGYIAPEAQQAAGDLFGTVGNIALGAGGVSTIGAVLLTAAKAIRTAIDAANLRGQNIGWDQREQAATIQAPLPTPGASA